MLGKTADLAAVVLGFVDGIAVSAEQRDDVVKQPSAARRDARRLVDSRRLEERTQWWLR